MKEEIVTAIVWDGAKTWNTLQQVTGLCEMSLNENLSELFDLGILENTNGDYRVNLELWKAIRSTPSLHEKEVSVKFSKEKKEKLIDWIEKWKAKKRLNFSLEYGHFFLDGIHLLELSKELIMKAENEVLVVNPSVNECALSEALIQSCKCGNAVKLVTRSPDNVIPEYRWYKKEYHSSLTKAGVTIRYNNQVQAKIITVDRTVAVMSSMNFCDSSGGAYLEAGIVSLEESVIEPTVNSIIKIFELPETKEMKN